MMVSGSAGKMNFWSDINQLCHCLSVVEYFTDQKKKKKIVDDGTKYLSSI